MRVSFRLDMIQNAWVEDGRLKLVLSDQSLAEIRQKQFGRGAGNAIDERTKGSASERAEIAGCRGFSRCGIAYEGQQHILDGYGCGRTIDAKV